MAIMQVLAITSAFGAYGNQLRVRCVFIRDQNNYKDAFLAHSVNSEIVHTTILRNKYIMLHDIANLGHVFSKRGRGRESERRRAENKLHASNFRPQKSSSLFRSFSPPIKKPMQSKLI